MTAYEDNVEWIPAVSITVEDAQLFQRLVNRGKNYWLWFLSTAKKVIYKLKFYNHLIGS